VAHITLVVINILRRSTVISIPTHMINPDNLICFFIYFCLKDFWITILQSLLYRNGFAQSVSRQRFVKHFQHATVDKCYCSLLFNSASMKTLAMNHVTCSLCGLPDATKELGFLCVVLVEDI
jgi:hypothetical protein